MKKVKILQKLSRESLEDFENRIANFVNDGWSLCGIGTTNYYWLVILVSPDEE